MQLLYMGLSLGKPSSGWFQFSEMTIFVCSLFGFKGNLPQGIFLVCAGGLVKWETWPPISCQSAPKKNLPGNKMHLYLWLMFWTWHLLSDHIYQASELELAFAFSPRLTPFCMVG